MKPNIRVDSFEAQKQQEPVAMQMDVIVVNLVREGINKHRARELAEHFIKHTSPPQRQPLMFPTMLRKMWSGSEVQAWLDENYNNGITGEQK